MAGTSANNYQTNPQFYLDPNQQDLLLAALVSNPDGKNNMFPNGVQSKHSTSNSQTNYPVIDSLDPSFFTSPQQATPSSNFGNFSLDDSPFVDYLDGDGSFDIENGENGDNSDLMIGGLPGDSPEGESESADKRKSPDDDADDPDGGGKRREHEDKTAKKPGRKPLTSEPTTKRKAQNRAAQRAFRERKEKHLKDLETKVNELEKASDAANHENGLLRAQVQRLQTELREYRKRLSLHSTSVSRSPPTIGGFPPYMAGNGATANNFQFEFPRFGGLPGSHILDNGPLAKASNKPSMNAAPAAAPAAAVRQNSNGQSLSPRNQLNGASANLPEKDVTAPSSTNGFSTTNGSSNLNGLFSPSLLNGIATNSPFSYNSMGAAAPSNRGSADSSTNQSRIFQFNSGSSSNSDSPSSSSVSQYGQNSSCSTSPEPSHNSPSSGKAGDNLDTINEGYECHGNSEGEITFCEKLNMACGNSRNPIPRAMSQSNATPAPAAAAKAPSTDINGIDFLATQNGGQFDPTLFGDYRESQAAIVGDGDFTGGFFNDAFPFTDFGTPFSFGDSNTPAVQKPNPMEEIERQQDAGDDEVVPGEDPNQLLNCHKIWNKLSNRPGFKDGSIDIDNLCSELRAKARCSESGVVVDHKDVEAALQRLPDGQRT
ncbi:PAP1-domain-containing protein [Lepidopterella palustris CBS 459.81]|uniref:PAP1-domain-containing protein n=1 Tax=Lepidopterella palustris CBS 459.81 TaxID=1314670 RepID=A0A8E2JJH8_9PEZI|nr:PAP1-domain-containing protein [Lepidopterella palustris CBS 459.81]